MLDTYLRFAETAIRDRNPVRVRFYLARALAYANKERKSAKPALMRALAAARRLPA